MQDKEDLLIILDSVSDDYYFLWECFSEYAQLKKSEVNLLRTFSQSLKKAFALKYLDFYEGDSFNGEEFILMNFELNDTVIEKLLDWKENPIYEIRITTSKLGIEFLNQFYY